MSRSLRVSIWAAWLVIAALPAHGEVADSQGATLVASFSFPGAEDTFSSGTDIDFYGSFAYVGQMGPEGGLHIFDIGRDKPRKLGFLSCPGGQNDVAVVRPGLVALGYQGSECGAPTGGVSLIDVSNPRKPRLRGSIPIPNGGTHTLTVYPGKPLIYSSPGGWDQEVPGVSPKTYHHEETIIDASDPLRPKIVGDFDPMLADCHDLTFRFTQSAKLAFCAGDTQTQIWDVSDPLAPTLVSQIVNPLISFHHSAETSTDGELLVIGDEMNPTECVGGTTGSMWIYDVSDPTLPVFKGRYDIPRGPLPEANIEYTCTAHNFKFVPGEHALVAAWYQAGFNVLDLSDPTQPVEKAFYMPDGGEYWSAYPFDGRVYASGMPGLEVFEVMDL